MMNLYSFHNISKEILGFQIHIYIKLPMIFITSLYSLKQKKLEWEIMVFSILIALIKMNIYYSK